MVIEMSESKEMSLKDWCAEGERLFGPDKKQWKWKCSNCGHVQTISDFIELRDQEILPPGTDIGNLVFYSCIGRFDTRIPKDDIGTVWNKESPCNYTLGGLFCFANTFVIDEFGKKIPVFDFAES